VAPTSATTIKMSDESQKGGVIGAVHDRFIFSRRTRVLADHLASLIPPGSRVLDVGCGDGTIDCLIKQKQPDIDIQGIDPLLRPNARIPVRAFDGEHIPYANRSFDVVMFVDVLHHTMDPLILLREAVRVAPTVVIKDHFREGLFAQSTLRLMDWVGNARHGVALPYNYWDRKQWTQAFGDLGLLAEREVSPALYPIPFAWVFGRNLHFVARLGLRATAANLA
jgi:SAM-dependent methyltransferase